MTTNAQTIADQLTALGLPVPPTITDALAVLAAAYAHEPATGPDISFAAMTLKAADVPKLIDAHVEATIRTASHHAARGELIDRLERRCNRAIATDADAITTALADVFTPAADAFTDAYRRLPAKWADAESLIRSGPDAVAVLIEAQHQLPTLDACRHIRESLPLAHTTPLYNGTAYIVVTDTLVAEAIARQGNTGPLGWWGNALSIEGATRLQWHPTPAEHRAYIETLPRYELGYVRDQVSGFGGHRIEKVQSR